MPNQVRSRQLPEDVESARRKYKKATDTAVGWCDAQSQTLTSKSENDLGCARLLSLATRIKQTGTDVPETVCWAFNDAIEYRKRVMRYYMKIPMPTVEDLDATKTHEYFIFILDRVYNTTCQKFIAARVLSKSSLQQAASKSSKPDKSQNSFELINMSVQCEQIKAPADQASGQVEPVRTAEAKGSPSVQNKDSPENIPGSPPRLVSLEDDTLTGFVPAKTIRRIEFVLKPFDQKCAVTMSSWSKAAQQSLPDMVAAMMTSITFQEIIAVSGTISKQLQMSATDELYPLLYFMVSKPPVPTTAITTLEPDPEATGATLAASWYCLLHFRKQQDYQDTSETPNPTSDTLSDHVDSPENEHPFTLAADPEKDRVAMESLLRDILQIKRRPKLALEDTYLDNNSIRYIQSATSKDCTFKDSFIAAFALQLAFASSKGAQWSASRRHDAEQSQEIPADVSLDSSLATGSSRTSDSLHNRQHLFRTGLPSHHLEFAEDIVDRLKAVRKHWSLYCDCGLGYHRDIDRLSGKLTAYIRNDHKDLCTQSPWLTGSRMVNMLKDVDDLGRGLGNYQSVAGAVLHLYNVLRRKGGLECMPVLDSFCEVLKDHVFQGQLPGAQFQSCFLRFVGGEQFQLSIDDLHMSRNDPSSRPTWGGRDGTKRFGSQAEIVRQESVARASEKPLVFFYDLVGKGFKMDTGLWARAPGITAKTSQVAQREVSQRHRQLEKNFENPLQDLRDRLVADFEGTLPVATVNYIKFYEDLAEVWSGVVKEPIIRDKLNISRSKCRCFDGAILIPGAISRLLYMADLWEDRGAAQAAMTEPPWNHWIHKFREKFEDAQVGDYAWGSL